MVWSGIGTNLHTISFEEASLMLPDLVSDQQDIYQSTEQLKRNKNPLPVKGVHRGQEDVSVRIDTTRAQAHKGCAAATASLFVVMQLQLVPRHLYAAKCASAHFELITTSHQRLDFAKGNIQINENSLISGEMYRHTIDIQHSNDQYQFSVHSTTRRPLRMEIAQNGTLKTKNIEESAKLLVEDSVSSHDSVENSADARVQVVESIKISAEVVRTKLSAIRPDVYFERNEDAWHLTVGEDYWVKMTLEDGNGNLLCVRTLHSDEIGVNTNSLHSSHSASRNMQNMVKLQSWWRKYICSDIEWDVKVLDTANFGFTEKDVFVHSRKENEFRIRPSMNNMEFTLSFSATGTRCKQPLVLAVGSKKVKVRDAVYFRNTSSLFCPHCDLSMDHGNQVNGRKLMALLPFTGKPGVHRMPVFFGGGSGRYRLWMNNSNITTVNDHDVTKGQDRIWSIITAQKLGRSRLFLIDYFNPDNYVHLDVEVAPVALWTLSENVVKEIEVGHSVDMPLMVRDHRGWRFSCLDGIRISPSIENKSVSVEFVAMSTQRMIEREIYQNTNNGKDESTELDGKDAKKANDKVAEIVKNVALNFASHRRQTGQFGTDYIDCDNLDGRVIVRGLEEGYDKFTITLEMTEMEGKVQSTGMFVSVYNGLKPRHSKVAIAININNPYVMKWTGGPNPWPTKEVWPVDSQFVHELEVSIPQRIGNNATKDFGYQYDGETLEFLCYRQFHGIVELTVSNLRSDSLPRPASSRAEIEVFCFPQFRYDSNSIEMGVGTRKNAKELYPKWVSSKAATNFTIQIKEETSDRRIVSVMDNERVQAKRLGEARISGTLMHKTGEVYIHPPGFHNSLTIIVSFEDFSMEMPALWMLEGNDQIVHIEGLDGTHHILPNRQNFDDVFVEWTSDDANIVQLAPILPRPDALVHSKRGGVGSRHRDEDAKRSNTGTGLSVRLVAHSVGQVNIKAVITLRNPPKQIKTNKFLLTRTVKVIPRRSPCNSIILKPNSSTALPGEFQPETNVDPHGQIYEVKFDYSDDTVFVEDKTLRVTSEARSGQHVVVTLVLQSPDRYAEEWNEKYPFNQASSLTVSVVEPTGLNVLSSPYGNTLMMDNAVYTESVKDLLSGNSQPFWTHLSSAQNVQTVDVSTTENVLCEKQSVLVKIAILDPLTRELHAMEMCKAVSNDTTIVDARKEVKIGTDRVGGAMYATVQLDALQPGYATITFQGEKDSHISMMHSSEEGTDYYVNDDPNFLRTFLTIRVLSAVECQTQFGVHFLDTNGAAKNKSVRGSTQRVEAFNERKQNVNAPSSVGAVAMEAQDGWFQQNRLAVVMTLMVAAVFFGCCCWNNLFLNGNLNTAAVNQGRHHAAQFNPMIPVMNNAHSGLNNPYRRVV